MKSDTPTFTVLQNPRTTVGRKPTAVIFDMDGCISECNPTARFDWTQVSVNAEIMAKQKPNWRIISLLNSLYAHHGADKSTNFQLLIVTGRPETYRTHTHDWLSRHKVKYNDLWMRIDGDDRADAEVKRTLFKALREVYDIWFVVEDRQRVVDMWREEGVLCLQCAKGDY